MGILFANNAISQLSAAITSSATLININLSDAPMFPSPAAATDFFMLTLENLQVNPPAREIVKVTAVNSAQFTVVRAQEGTTAQNWAAGATAAHRVTAGTLRGFLSSAASSVSALYLGAFQAAPSTGANSTSLIPGNLYFNTTSNTLFAYNGVAWVAASTTGPNGLYGLYMGAFNTAPLVNPDGSALVAGSLYYNTANQGLYEFDGSAWDLLAGTNNSTTAIAGNLSVGGNETVAGNLTVDGNINDPNGTGYFENIVVTDDTSTGTLHLAGKLVVDVGDVSGTAIQQNFPSGCALQCGTGTSGPITFPTPFTSVPTVVVSPAGGNGPGYAFVVAYDITNTGFTAGSATSSNTPNTIAFNWMAFGPVTAANGTG